MTNSQLTDLRTLILSEVGDFFAVVGSPGEPETPEEMQRELSMRLGRILNNHIVNYPRCEVLVEILRECRTARDEAQAELQERRKADSEPVASNYRKLFTCTGCGAEGLDEPLETNCHCCVDGAHWVESRLYLHAQPAPVVQDEREAFEAFVAKRFGDLVDQRRAKNGDHGYVAWDMVVAWIVWQARAAMLQAEPVTTANKSGNSPVIPDGYVLVPRKLTEDMIAAAMNCEDVIFNSDDSFCVQFGNIYDAMLAADPQEVGDA